MTGLPASPTAECRPSRAGTHRHSRDKLDSYIADYNAMLGTSWSARDGQSFYNYYKDIAKRIKERERVVAPPNLTEAQAAEAKQALKELAKILGRATADACHRLGISFDMDDPHVARELMLATVEALVLSEPAQRKAAKRGGS